jgi:hypothetical protein
VHDVGFTQNFIIVLDLPVTFQPQRALGAAFPYFWNDQQAPRIGLLPRNGDLAGLIWFEAPSCWVWHIVNAYEAEGGEVVVDVPRHPRMFDHAWWVGTDLEAGLLCPSPLAEPAEQISRNGLPRLHSLDGRHTVAWRVDTA